MNFSDSIMDYREDILHALSELIAIKSVSCENESETERALDYVLNKARDMGFAVKKTGRVAGTQIRFPAALRI